MGSPFWLRLALAGVTLLLGGACSSDDTPSTTAQAVGSSSSSAPAPTTTVAVAPTTTTPATTVPAAPAVAEAGGWRLVVTAPTHLATVGPVVDVCYTLTGPSPGDVALDVGLWSSATNSPVSNSRVPATVGSGSARVEIGSPDPRFYDMTVQALANGQPIDRLVVKFGVRTGSAPPTGCP
jgi:hypothetical protein